MFEPLEKDECCGCMACLNVCPRDVISICKDSLGFSYPVIQNTDKCINCNRCNDVCPLKKKRHFTTNVGQVLCTYNKDADERVYSSSGGIFPLLCKAVLESGGICYGVAFNAQFKPEYLRVDNIVNLKHILSSKYAEAEKGIVYRQVKHDLSEGKKVLFSGTPCIVYGLKEYLKKDYENLILVDLFCYGIPSPEIWQRWLKYISNGKEPVFVDFRDKSRGWDNYSLRVDYSDGTTYCEPKARDKYIATFSKGAFIRQSCYKCTLKAFPRASDITLGDFQELKEIFPKENPRLGWSMVRINTAHGKEVFDAISDKIVSYVVKGEIMDTIHPGIGSSSTKHPNREVFEQNLDKMEIDSLLRKYASLTMKMKINNRVYTVKKTVKKILRATGIRE